MSITYDILTGIDPYFNLTLSVNEHAACINHVSKSTSKTRIQQKQVLVAIFWVCTPWSTKKNESHAEG